MMPVGKLLVIALVLGEFGLPSLAHAEDALRFRRGTAAVGELSDHRVGSSVEVTMTRRHGDQLIDSRQQSLRQEQQRTLQIVALDPTTNLPTRGKLTYRSAHKTLRVGQDQEALTPDPVSGKVYLVERRGRELLVATTQGDLPPPDERQIVQANLQAFGIPNPLAAYLENKVIRTGQKLIVPEEVGRELLGLDADDSTVERFELTLRERTIVDGSECGLFTALLQTHRRQGGQATILMQGDMVVSTSSCRVLAMTLEGPLVVSERHGTAAAHYTEQTQGTIRVSMRASHSVPK